MMTKRKDVPLYLVDEHNLAFFYWQQARIEGYLPDAVDLFHVDAHDDMAKPTTFRTPLHFRSSFAREEIEYYEKFARQELNIANFIFPAVLSGVVKNVYFVFPKWRKFKTTRKEFFVASAFGEGKVLKYTIRPEPDSSPLVERAFPDLKRFRYFAMEADKLPQKRKIILDIDMDYFACRDSIHNLMSFELEITREQFLARDVFLAGRTVPFSGLEFSFFEREGKWFARIEKKKGRDHCHLPSVDELEREIDTLVTTLLGKKIRPALVTVCRSCNSGYCPEEYSRFIEPLLLAKLAPLTAGQS